MIRARGVLSSQQKQCEKRKGEEEEKREKSNRIREMKRGKIEPNQKRIPIRSIT